MKVTTGLRVLAIGVALSATACVAEVGEGTHGVDLARADTGWKAEGVSLIVNLSGLKLPVRSNGNLGTPTGFTFTPEAGTHKVSVTPPAELRGLSEYGCELVARTVGHLSSDDTDSQCPNDISIKVFAVRDGALVAEKDQNWFDLWPGPESESVRFSIAEPGEYVVEVHPLLGVAAFDASGIRPVDYALHIATE